MSVVIHSPGDGKQAELEAPDLRLMEVPCSTRSSSWSIGHSCAPSEQAGAIGETAFTVEATVLRTTLAVCPVLGTARSIGPASPPDQDHFLTALAS